MIIDGGQCSYGIESTVVKIVAPRIEEKGEEAHIKLLRRGGISEIELIDAVKELGVEVILPEMKSSVMES